MNSTKILTGTILIVFLVTMAQPARLAAQKQVGQNVGRPRYKLVYLQTLGGPTSGISCCGILPAVLNDEGTAVGVADTDVSYPNIAIENPILGSCCPLAFVAWQSHVPIELPVLSGGHNNFANAIPKGLIAVEHRRNPIGDNV
jgi:hypothetical protein